MPSVPLPAAASRPRFWPAASAARLAPAVDEPADLGRERGAPRHRPERGGGRIEVGARRDSDGGVRLWVEDSGAGIDETQAPGTGLANLRERLAAAYAGAARLALHAREPQGVRAEISLPPGSPP